VVEVEDVDTFWRSSASIVAV